MNARSRRNFVNSLMAATAAAMSGSPLIAAPWQDPPTGAPAGGRGRPGGPPRPPRPRPAGIAWNYGTGIQSQPNPNTWDLKDHTRLTMENVKKRVAANGGTMSDFLYFQVFYCLHLDDKKPMPTGSALFAAYRQGLSGFEQRLQRVLVGHEVRRRAALVLRAVVDPGQLADRSRRRRAHRVERDARRVKTEHLYSCVRDSLGDTSAQSADPAEARVKRERRLRLVSL